MSIQSVMFTSSFWLFLVLLAIMSKKLISCSSCKQDHPPRGGIFCIYTREAKKLCSTLGVSEDEFALHIDLDKVRTDSHEYIKDNITSDLPVVSDEMVQRLIADNIAQREALARQDEKFDKFISCFEKLVVNECDSDSRDTDGASAKDPPKGIDTGSKSVDPHRQLSEQLFELLNRKSQTSTNTSPVFAKVSQIRHDPVLQKHTAETHFNPLVHGHRPRGSARDRGDDYYSDHSPSRDYRTADRKRRKLLYFDLEPHMAFDSRSTDYRTFEDVLSANLSLVDTLSTQGYSISCYLKHIRFLVDKSKIYNSSALIRYDQAVRERADVLGENTMVYGDHELVHRFLGPENLKPKSKPVSDSKSVKESERSNARRKLPVGLCWKWNFGRKCQGSACTLKHLCTECYGAHRSADCSKNDSKPTPSLQPPR